MSNEDKIDILDRFKKNEIKNFGQKKTYYKADKRKYKYNFDYCEYDD